MATTLQECLVDDNYEGVCAKRMTRAEMEGAMARNKIRAQREHDARLRQLQMEQKLGFSLPKSTLKSNNLFWGSLIVIGAGLVYLYTKK